MANIFVSIYRFFEKHTVCFYFIFAAVIALLALAALQLKFDENIMQFFPDTEKGKHLNRTLSSLKINDKIVVMFTPSPQAPQQTEEQLPHCADDFKTELMQALDSAYITDILTAIDDGEQEKMQNFVFRFLPLFLTEEDYIAADSLLQPTAFAQKMQTNFENLISPQGIALKDYILHDPLSMAATSMKHLEDMAPRSGFQQQNGYIFSSDGKTLIAVITPANSMGDTGKNEILVTEIEKEIESLLQRYPNIQISYFGSAPMSVYNARQIKLDIWLTLGIALTAISVFIAFAFRRKRTVALMVFPAIFGGLFALAFTAIIKGSISAIAVGSGAVVLGIALGYPIHMLVHRQDCKNISQLIKEITYPLSVGSFTTIGAFAGLLFTNSHLLRDIGLFASLALIGASLFCLIFLPHFLKEGDPERKGKIMLRIEKINSYPFHKNKWLTGAIIIIFTVCAFAATRIDFDADMLHLNFEPPKLKKAELQLNAINRNQPKTTLCISTGDSLEQAIDNYSLACTQLDTLQKQGIITSYASPRYFTVSASERKLRLARWQKYWDKKRIEQTKTLLERECNRLGLDAQAFSSFTEMTEKDCSSLESEYLHTISDPQSLFADWLCSAGQTEMILSQVIIPPDNRQHVVDALDQGQTIVYDRAYFTSQWVEDVNSNFNLVLYISSLLIFITLLISYGRIELALISFLPMFVSWIIIVGVMAMLGIPFNIVSIILSTFIFGTGDDFSIFIMDGLEGKYRSGKKVLNSHKTAIFFSAFTIVAGMGSMIFAQHPALRSISIMSMLGMIVVVLVSYTVSPLVYNWLILRPASRHNPPYTWYSLLETAVFYLLFFTGCVFLRMAVALFCLLPVKKLTKRRWTCFLLHLCCRFMVFSAFMARKVKIGFDRHTFQKPALVIANHQSVCDILVMLSLSPRIVLGTKNWVYRSPFFGAIIRYAGFINRDEGSTAVQQQIYQRLQEGFSIVIFPEGTRSIDGTIRRFHKGVFHYSQLFETDIQSILLYGMGAIISKTQPAFVRHGTAVYKALPRIAWNDPNFGDNYSLRCKNIQEYFRSHYNELCCQYSQTSQNSFFYRMLVKSYTYKGPVEEWYVRIKVKMEKQYDRFHKLLPLDARILDIGCGYGMLCYMMAMQAPQRKLTGIDYDSDKIDVALHNFLKNDNTDFIAADALECDLPKSDAIILNDVLHYMSSEKQQILLKKCLAVLSPKGMMIVRDGNRDEVKKQRITRLSEVFSTRIFFFNKTREQLCFLSASQMQRFADENALKMETCKNDRITSNTIFIFRRP